MANYTSTSQLNINKHVLSIRKAFAQGYFPSYGDEFAPIHLHGLTQFSCHQLHTFASQLAGVRGVSCAT